MLSKAVELPVGGYLPQSLVDYPGCVAAVVFTQGCNFRCPYCHNPELVDPAMFGEWPVMAFSDVLARIGGNKALLDGVVVTGGEPTIHASLPAALREIKGLGLKVKLDTNGSNPALLAVLLSERLVDIVAMDIKAPLNSRRYSVVAGVPCSSGMIGDIQRSCELLVASGIETMFRSTLLKGIHEPEDVAAMAECAGRPLLLQRFRSGRTLDASRAINYSGYSGRELLEIAEKATCSVVV